MPQIVLYGLAGWGLLCLTSTLFLITILCIDWRGMMRQRRMQRELDKMTAPKTEDDRR